MQNGKGTITFTDGGTYTGNFKDNTPDGRGYKILIGGDEIFREHGEYKDGKWVPD